MASSNVEMASTSKTNPDLPRESSVCSISTIIADLHHSDSSRNLVSMSMDDLLKNIYSDGQSHNQVQVQVQDETTIIGASIARQESFPLPKDLSTRTVEEVWKEIVAGSDQRREAATDQEITLEDFLSKAGAVREDVRVPVISKPGGYAVDSTALNNQFQMPSQQLEGAMVAYGSGIEGRMVGVGRGKRRAVEEPVDKATQQKQRRMIKNRESAARSRERKQAYTLELESLVAQLEEENARLLREEVTICR
ncbi:ABSCISIC ACID-INSENSITIVE 5-like protein 2 isoform X2 [Momordica charantia]|uniref:ABSCISIC ACID-INSENSITIVE 5-like protein 2 isoform X2 n=1 Tax=Momordica charantia TaxID=3673 RepID=A0A6J1DZX2_MOMCH|nr:ABSCISIC ACID-INSENSITIVE 5-like protein 2 isoform X2 [Momordica charantia]